VNHAAVDRCPSDNRHRPPRLTRSESLP
jgi:hypothetical protein